MHIRAVAAKGTGFRSFDRIAFLVIGQVLPP